MRARHVLATAVSLLALAIPATARELLTDDEMENARGGVLVAGGVAFEFGAVVRTFEDGVLALQTQLTVTPDGAQIQQLAGQNVSQLTDQLLSQLNAAGVVSDSELARNAYITDSGAVIMQQLSQGQLVNVLMNTESGRTFRQDTDVTITLPGFAGYQADIAREVTGLRLTNDLNAVMVGF